MLPKTNRLDLATKFRYLKKSGQVINTPYFTILYHFSSPAPFRAGFIVSNKIGSATVRSRTKRLLREVVQQKAAIMPSGLEMVLIARVFKGELDLEKLIVEFDKVLPKIRP